ncbi:hypothetical protein MTZ49_15700 [Entomomonas sp. E2T0]|uniref:hypothetical protein n=1 Tax=Entomomonas sp. E2T0 TaxID=2930213 RepID=UPI00222835D4|nr:hypothetical protein [Entomomonas sp. E2T0]UYZ84013.1 hypothetical protein MTZ49_15700 [Entomomonas sp. E2T0]
MGSDNRFIYYSTIHLNRREEILVQSIISLYNSKDDYKWAHKDSSDTIVVVVGSDAKALLSAGEDPFSAIKEQHIVCILGDIFYPKNARAVVPIALPIKALHLVDKLSHIEKNIISKPFSLGYIAANQVANKQENEDTVSSPRGAIDFWPKTDAAEVISQETVTEDVPDKPAATEATPSNQTSLSSTVDAISVLNEYNILKDSGVNETVIESQSVLTKETVDYVPPKMVLQPSPQTTEESLDKPISYVKPSVLTAKLEPIDNLTPTLTEVASPELVPITPISPVIPTLQEKVTVETPTLTEVVPPTIEQLAVTEEPVKPVVVESIEVEEVNEFSKRIKLLRWPKSEVIQRHPGNAILASMVINVPMSVEDMAKQSDLPLAVCQRFMDAVVESKVAEYVDLIEEKLDEPVVKEEPPKEEVSQRKGILYRIRAALGLLRK